MPSDEEVQKAFADYAAHVRADMLPKLVDSSIMVSLSPGSKDGSGSTGDVKYWCELGAAIMHNKPLLVVASPGQELSERLLRVADEVVRVDMNSDEGLKQLGDAVVAFSMRFPDA